MANQFAIRSKNAYTTICVANGIHHVDIHSVELNTLCSKYFLAKVRYYHYAYLNCITLYIGFKTALIPIEHIYDKRINVMNPNTGYDIP